MWMRSQVFAAVLQPDLEQHVSEPSADFGFRHDAVQLFVEGFIATAPIDSFVHMGKKELEKGREIAEQSLFPGRVEIEPWPSFAHERNVSQRRTRPQDAGTAQVRHFCQGSRQAGMLQTSET